MFIVRRIQGFASNPFLYALVAVYLVSSYVLSHYTETPFSERLFGLLFFAILSALMFLATWRVSPNPIQITSPKREAVFVVLYFACWLILNLALWTRFFGRSSLYSNGSFWLLLVIIPSWVLLRRGYRFTDMGITRKHLRANIRVGLLSGVILVAILLLMTPGGRLLLSGEIELNMIIMGLLVAFGFSLLTAAIHEEFFFRAILQTRLSLAFNSQLSGLILATLLFSLYHLPFALYGSSSRPPSEIGYALTIIFTDGIFGGLIVGVLWMRTRNLLVPILIHTLIDTISGFPMVIEMLNSV